MSSSSKSSKSNSANKNGSTIDLRPIYAQSETNTTPISNIELLARDLGGLFTGALHTALLFETDNEYVVTEYGDTGLEVEYYSKNKVNSMEPYKRIIGSSEIVHVFDITSCFRQLKLNDVYEEIDQMKENWTPVKYNFLNHNCRDYVLKLCKSLDSNDECKTLVNVFQKNYPGALQLLKQFLPPLFLFFPSHAKEHLISKFHSGYWDLEKEKYYKS